MVGYAPSVFVVRIVSGTLDDPSASLISDLYVSFLGFKREREKGVSYHTRSRRNKIAGYHSVPLPRLQTNVPWPTVVLVDRGGRG